MNQYLLTEAQRDELYMLIEKDGFPNQPAIEMLQSLPMVSGKPVAYRLADPDIAKKHHYFDLDEVEPVKHALEPLYTHAQPLTPITADDVTDEMIDELDRQCPTYNTVEVDRQTIAAAVNIYNTVIKHRSEA